MDIHGLHSRKISDCDCSVRHLVTDLQVLAASSFLKDGSCFLSKSRTRTWMQFLRVYYMYIYIAYSIHIAVHVAESLGFFWSGTTKCFALESHVCF